MQASLRATADRLAREKRERDDKAKADCDKAVANLKKSVDKAKGDLKKIGNAFKSGSRQRRGSEGRIQRQFLGCRMSKHYYVQRL